MVMGKTIPPRMSQAFSNLLRACQTQNSIEPSMRRNRALRFDRIALPPIVSLRKIELPSGFMAIGDSVCALCPIYGQGMTVSALSSLLLRDWLTRPSSQQQFPNGASFQKQLARSNAFPWSLATGLDSRFPTTQGTISPNWVSKLFRGYTERLAAHAHKDADLHLWFMEMAHMMKPPRIVD
jgi:hypothetical protein